MPSVSRPLLPAEAVCSPLVPTFTCSSCDKQTAGCRISYIATHPLSPSPLPSSHCPQSFFHPINRWQHDSRHVRPSTQPSAHVQPTRHRQVRQQFQGPARRTLLICYRLQGVPVPPKIKCGRCHKNFPNTKYSTKQLTDLRYQIHHVGRMTTAINCKNCTGQQIVEIECTMCHKTKGITEFAKSQKSKPDTAVRITLLNGLLILMSRQKCYTCIDDQLAREAVDGDRYEGDHKRLFVTPDSHNGYTPDYWSSADSTAGSSASGYDWTSVNGDNDKEDGGVALSNTFQRAMSFNGSVPETLIESEYTLSGHAANGNADGWSEVRTRSWHTGSSGVGSASGHGNRTAETNSGTQHSYASTVAERSDAADVRPNGWAKIKGCKPQPVVC
jgi:DNA repair protein RAD7